MRFRTWDAITAQDVFGDGYAATKLPTFTVGDAQVQQDLLPVTNMLV